MPVQAPDAEGRDDGTDALTKVRVLRDLNSDLGDELWAAVRAARVEGYSLRRIARAAGLSTTHLARLLAEEDK